MAIRGSLINFSWATFQNWIYQDLNVTAQEKWSFTTDSSKAKLSQGAYEGWQNLCRMADKKTGQLLLPSSFRVENINDIIPKFPSASGISSLGKLYGDSLPAGKIQVGYKDLTVSLSTVFTMLHTTMIILEFTHGISTYVQTNGNGKMISIPLSGNNNGRDIMNWLSEAAYQHGMAKYALQEGVPVIDCVQ